MDTVTLTPRRARLAIGVVAQFAFVAAVAACSDDDRASAPLSRVTGPTPVSFAKGQDKGGSTTRRIAFIGQFDKLSTMRPDGTDIVRLPGSNAAEDADPAWSPDYMKLTFVSNRGGGINNLHIANVDMTGLENILPGHYVRNPSFSPDGTKIVFQNASISGAANWDIWVIDLQTRNFVPLTTNPAADVDPHFSRDGSRIFFTSHRDGHPEVYSMNPDGTNQTRMTFCGVACFSAVVSPAGDRLAFSSTAFGNSILVTAPGDLLRYQAVTPAGQVANEFFLSPTWSPDGKKIAFEGIRNGSRGIWVANPDGSGLVNLTPGVIATAPAWSW